MKQIRLDNYHEYVVSDKAYERIVALVEANQVCKTCGRAYTKDNPRVAEHTCLWSFLKRDANRHRIFIGLLAESEYGRTYGFRDKRGYIYLSHTSSDKCEVSNYYTALHWGFVVPGTFDRNGTDVKLSPDNYWNIYGNFRENSVVVIEYWEAYGDRLRVAFLANKKDGSLVEINKRKATIRQLFAQARAQVESTKDEHGAYHIGNGEDDWTTYQISDTHLYRVISDIASAEYDQRQQEKS